MVSVEQANEVVAKPRELESEHNLMKDLFNRALRTSQSGSDVKLNFRQAEQHMPGIGKATEHTEYIFKFSIMGFLKIFLSKKVLGVVGSCCWVGWWVGCWGAGWLGWFGVAYRVVIKF